MDIGYQLEKIMQLNDKEINDYDNSNVGDDDVWDDDDDNGGNDVMMVMMRS